MMRRFFGSISNRIPYQHRYLTREWREKFDSATNTARGVFWGPDGSVHRLVASLCCTAASVLMMIGAAGVFALSEQFDLGAIAWSGFGVILVVVIMAAFVLATIGHERTHEWVAARVGLPGKIYYGWSVFRVSGTFAPAYRRYCTLDGRDQVAICAAPVLGLLVAYAGNVSALWVAGAGGDSVVVALLIATVFWGPSPSDVLQIVDILRHGSHELDVDGAGHRWAEGVHL